jgi:hypothetical protein
MKSQQFRIGSLTQFFEFGEHPVKDIYIYIPWTYPPVPSFLNKRKKKERENLTILDPKKIMLAQLDNYYTGTIKC